jgi:regulatory subunit for Cdc7p protein kinase
MVQLRGYYIYIHDMDELTKPVMVREYPKVAKKEDGKWPQFRVSGVGKCPFVLDPHHIRKQQEQHQEEQRQRALRAAAPRTRAAAALEERRVLVENSNIARRTSTTTSQTVREEEVKLLEASKAVPTKGANTDSMPPLFGSAQANIRAIPRFAGGEPVASGIMPSNITSAIRSQMISSTTAGPGARAGNSKEVNQLKRKVLEKNSMPATKTTHAGIDDMRAALNQEYAQPPRAAKRKAQDALGYIKEEAPVQEYRQGRKAAVMRRRKTVDKELKPGYCENCGEKFNDFDEVRIAHYFH